MKVLIFVIIFIVFSLNVADYNVYPQNQPAILSFQISEQDSIDSDLAIIQVLVSSLDLNQSQSYENVANSTTILVNDQFIGHLGIPKKNISTISFSTTQQYNSTYDGQQYQQVFTGYLTEHTLQVIVKIDVASSIIDVSNQVDYVTVQSISFEASQESQWAKQLELLSLASANAHAEAQALISPLQQKIKRLLSVNSQPYFQPAPSPVNANSQTAQAIQVYPTQSIISVSVSFEYEITSI